MVRVGGLFVGFCVLVLLTPGCRRDPARVTARRLENLQALAARDLACPAVALSIAEIEEHLYRATGCNQWADYYIHARGRGRYTSATWTRVVPLAERAQADLVCPAAMIAFEPLTPTAFRVAGCGRGATMNLLCGDVDCGWLATGITAATSPTPPPATPAGATITGTLVVPAP